MRSLLSPLYTLYHWLLPRIGAGIYRFPAKKMVVVLVTGTKGKSSTVEILASILKADGQKVAYTNSVHFAMYNAHTETHEVKKNELRMSMPGRFFLQKFLHTAYINGCTHAVIEATSEGARYFRHHCLYPNVVVVTNIAPEHIESHGSFENYLDCKLSLVDALASSPKLDKALVVNTDDSYATAFTDRLERRDSGHTVTQLAYNRDSGINLVYTDHGVSFIAGKTPIESTLPGLFSAYNILAALTAARHLGVTESALVAGIRAVTVIPGRAEFIREGQSFDVVVDYAHTAESLEALYTTFAAKHIIGVLGSMGGGRDTWKRKKMGAVADTHCSTIILTDEDPCDEEPEKIVREILTGITAHTPLIIMNRREAIREAFRLADASTEPTAVLITGKGTDNSIKRAHGTSEPWSDADVAREELARLAQKA